MLLRYEVPCRVGRVYETGTIKTSNLWTDDYPLRSSSTSSLPAGYEMRWWALDGEGSEDDVVADVLEFATHTQAENALRRAAGTHCRTDAMGRARRFPSGSSNLVWVNPVGAREWDVLFVRDHRLYRVADVPPAYLLTTPEPAQRRLERLGTQASVNQLACAIPQAGCPAPVALIENVGLPRLIAGAPPEREAAVPITRAQATAYAHAVNLRDYFVPGMTELAPERQLKDRGYGEGLGRCAGGLRSLHAVATIRSPVFGYENRSGYETVASTVTMLPSAATADRYLAVLASEQAGRCLTRAFTEASRAGAAKHSHRRVRLIAATPLPAPAPTSYRAPGPYRGNAQRLVVEVSYVTRLGKHARALIYFEDFAFAQGRAVIGLSATSVARPFPQANERFLMSTLVGRAEADED